jgi:hypothetical protein
MRCRMVICTQERKCTRAGCEGVPTTGEKTCGGKGSACAFGTCSLSRASCANVREGGGGLGEGDDMRCRMVICNNASARARAGCDGAPTTEGETRQLRGEGGGGARVTGQMSRTTRGRVRGAVGVGVDRCRGWGMARCAWSFVRNNASVHARALRRRDGAGRRGREGKGRRAWCPWCPSARGCRSNGRNQDNARGAIGGCDGGGARARGRAWDLTSLAPAKSKRTCGGVGWPEAGGWALTGNVCVVVQQLGGQCKCQSERPSNL